MNTHQNGIVVTVAGDFLKDPEIKDITKLLL
jgi:hypothetical protein